jgi:ketosteroid isomerase-like protein
MPALSIEERLQINDLIVDYCNSVDVVGNVDGVCALFAEDAEYDVSAFGLGQFKGVDAIRGFFSGVFPNIAASAHYVTNIAIRSGRAGEASASAYVLAWSVSKAGDRMEVKARYDLDLIRTASGWRFAKMAVALLLPVG